MRTVEKFLGRTDDVFKRDKRRHMSQTICLLDWARASSTCKAWLALPITKLDLRKSANGILWASRHCHTAKLLYFDTTNLDVTTIWQAVW
ncbi:g8517 [Coccomyxa elongata]